MLREGGDMGPDLSAIDEAHAMGAVGAEGVADVAIGIVTPQPSVNRLRIEVSHFRVRFGLTAMTHP